MRRSCLLATILLLTAIAVVEILFLYPVAWYVYVAALTLSGLSLLQIARLRRQLRQLLFFVLFATVATALYTIPWSSRKPFLRDLAKITPGMTQEQVLDHMSGYILGTGWPPNPFTESQRPELVVPSALVFRHSNHGSFNSDWGVVYFEDGRVTRVKFMPD